MIRKIILFGSNGQLGSNIKEKINKKKFKLKCFNSFNGDITDYKKINEIFSANKPNIIIIAAAITNVDFCENNKKLCYRANTLAVKNLSKLCYKYKSLLIHFSSDYIFSSNKIKFFSENSLKKPVNYYGKCKLQSEEVIQKSKCSYLIFRISWLYSNSKNNFFNFFINSINNKKEIKIIKDSYSSPTSVRLVIKILNIFLLKKNHQNYRQIYNLSCNGIASWKEIFLHIVKSLNKKNKQNLKISFVSKLDNWRAKRPFCSKISCKKIEKFLDIKIPFWKKELNYYLNK